MRKVLLVAVTIALAVGTTSAVKAVGTRHEQVLTSTADLGRAGIIWSADMAYDPASNVLLAVWVNGDRIRGQFFTLNKSANQFDALTDFFPVSYGVGHYFVRASFGAGKFLVSYGIARGAGFGVVREFRMVSYDADGDQAVVVPGPVSKGTELDTMAGRGSGASVFVPGNTPGEGSTLGDHFVVSWPSEGQTYARRVFPDGSTTPARFRITAASPCNLAAPEMAVNPATGVVFVVGFRDPTSTVCAGQGGLWNQYITDGGANPADMEYVVEGKDMKGLHWEHGVAFGEGRFQIAWNRKTEAGRGIYGRGYDDTGATDPVALIKAAVPGLPPWDNALGQVGIGYDPTTDKYLVGMRGADVGDGKAAVFRLEVDKNGALEPESFQRLTENLAPAPEPVVDGDGTGYMFVMYRGGWSRINMVVFEPENPPVVDGPNLAVSALTVPANALQGATIQIDETTINRGTEDVTVETKTKYYISTNASWDAGDILLGERTVPALAVDATDAVADFELTLPDATQIPPGDLFILAKADADEAVAEGSEFDNVTARAITIVGFDLNVQPKTFIAPLSGVAGSTISTIRDTTRNLGPAPAPASITRFYLSKNGVYGDGDDVVVGERNVPALAPGAVSASTTGSITIPGGTTPGLYTLFVRADGPNAFFETVEPNNRQQRSFTVKAAPRRPAR